MSAVLAIIAIVTAGTFSMGNSVIESARRVNTTNKLDAIEETLTAFRLANNRLPCPGDATLDDTPANATTYGWEANNASGTCTGGTPHANFSYTLPSPPSNTNIPGGTAIAEGAVPVKALGLPDDFQWDGWGRKFAYAVWTPLTATNAFITYGVHPSGGGITVENAGHGYRTTIGAYTLISYGPDGHGGYLKNGGATRYSSGSTNADELINCHCNSSAADTGYAATYVEHEAAATFDDIVRYEDRWQMQNDYDAYNPNGIPSWPGFRMEGINANDQTGFDGFAVGDVNGDGIPDLIIGSPHAKSTDGIVYVVFGTRKGFPDPLPLSTLDGSNGFELDGLSGNWTGGAVAAGDVNGDGIDDIIIGAPYSSPRGISGAGATYVVFGGTTRKDWNPWSSCAHTSPCTLQSGSGHFLDGTNGFEIDGVVSNEESGSALAVGKIRGSTMADIIIGASTYQSGGIAIGATYVVFGSASPMARSTYILDGTAGTGVIDGTNGFELNGTSSSTDSGCGGCNYYGSGYSVATGDFNGDKYADIIISAPYGKVGSNEDAGKVYVIFGGATGTNHGSGGKLWSSCTHSSPCILQSGSSNFLNGSNGFEIDGSGSQWYAGSSLATGDINNDGNGDLVIGSPWSSGVYGGGAAYIVFGTPSAMSSMAYTLDSSPGTGVIDGTHGFELDGGASNNQTGLSVAAGDINQDGYADVIVGVPGNSGRGDTDIVFGSKSPMSSNAYTLDNQATGLIDGTHGIDLAGPSAYDEGGLAKVAAGDLNKDDYADIIIGEGLASPPEGSKAGAIYVYFGHKTTTLDPWPATPYDTSGL